MSSKKKLGQKKAFYIYYVYIVDLSKVLRSSLEGTDSIGVRKKVLSCDSSQNVSFTGIHSPSPFSI
jgi:hypothetical protein